MSRKIKHVPGSRYFVILPLLIAFSIGACEFVEPVREPGNSVQECSEPFLTTNMMAIRVRNISMVPVDSLQIEFISSDGNWNRKSVSFTNVLARKSGCYRVVNRTVKGDDGRAYLIDYYLMKAWPDRSVNSSLQAISMKSGKYTYVVRFKREFYDYLTQEPRQEEPMNKLRIRIQNVSDVDFDNVVANFHNKEIDYGSIPSGAYSAFFDVDLAYRYAYLKIIAGRDTLVWQPIDYVGEAPLPVSAYSFAVDKREGSTVHDQGGFVLDELR